MATNAERTVTAPNPLRAPLTAYSVDAAHEAMYAPDGTSYHGLRVSGLVPTRPDTYYEVWAKPAEAGNESWLHLATSKTLPIYVRDPVLFGFDTSYTIALVIVSALGASVGPEGSTQATVTLTTGPIPDVVTGFTATVEGGQVLFAWTPPNATENPDVLGFEIRAGTTGWSSATFVGFVAGVLRTWLSVPRSKAPGTGFYIKARTRLGAYSATPGSATLSAVDAACLDAESMVEPSEQQIPAGLREATITTVCAYATAPFFTFGSANPSTAPQSKRTVLYNSSNYVQNGNLTWSFTLRASARAPAAGAWYAHLQGGG